ncbi:hypothetical protein SAZ_01485 [Streptomyces noursei ZPM]|nr:hypothetical protein SAZ_01485 [Streptomyces noursei ZPM]EPY92073.1 hypothetical protein K530_55270 [Streptomyces noursei CCRC 11814]
MDSAEADRLGVGVSVRQSQMESASVIEESVPRVVDQQQVGGFPRRVGQGRSDGRDADR